MELSLTRTSTNCLYTLGSLRINGRHQTYTVEYTLSMLPAGQYTVRIVKYSARKQSICIFSSSGEGHEHSPLTVITVCHSWISCRNYRQPRPSKSPKQSPSSRQSPTKTKSPIGIGLPLIPGAMYKGTPHYGRITDRLMKCTARKESITLTISGRNCIHEQPVSHWLRPNTH